MSGKTIQPLERFGAIGLGAKDADEHLGRPQVASDLDRGDGHHAGDPRILDPFVEKARNFLPNGFGQTIRTPILCHIGFAGHARPKGARGHDQVVAAPSVRANSSVR